MRRLIASIAKFLGWKTHYLITYTWQIPADGRQATYTGTITVRPWLQQDHFDELKTVMASTAAEAGYPGEPNILCITRIGD